MAMPKAAVHEHDSAVLQKHEIWLSQYLARMQSEAKTSSMQRPPKRYFGFRVLPLYPRHHPGTRLLINDIRHVRPGVCPKTYYTPAE